VPDKDELEEFLEGAVQRWADLVRDHPDEAKAIWNAPPQFYAGNPFVENDDA
jgi:hypothetical protein